MQNENLFDLRWGLSVIRRRILLIIGLMVFTAAVAILVLSLMPRQYEASITMLVQPARDAQLSDYNVLLASQQMAITYSEMVKGRAVMEAVIQKLGISETPDELAKKIDATAIRDTQLLRITVKDTDSARATSIANALAEAFSAHVKALQLERYADTLQGAQAKLDATTAQITDAQGKIDTLNAQKSQQDAEIARLQSSLAEQQASYNLTQQTYQNLQLSMTNVEETVKVFAPASITARGAGQGYIATTTLLIKEGTSVSSISTSSVAPIDVLAPTFKQMFTHPAVLEGAIKKLGLSETAVDLARNVSASSVPGTQLFKLSVTNADEQQAVKTADAIADAYVTQLRQRLAEPLSASLATTQEQIGTLSKQLEATQANLKSVSSESANIETQISQLNTSVTTYRSDLRTFQQNYDNLRLTAAAAADNVVVTEPAGQALPSQSRMLYVAIAVAVSLIVGLILAFLLEVGRTESALKQVQKVGPAAPAGR